MPVLTITYCGMTLFSGEVDGFRWDDVPGQSVTVTGQLAKQKATSGAGGLSVIADMIAQASKAKTAEKLAEKRRDYEQLVADADTTAETVEDAADDY